MVDRGVGIVEAGVQFSSEALSLSNARVVELVDTLALRASGPNGP